MRVKRSLIIMFVLMYTVFCLPMFASAESAEVDIRSMNIEQYFTLSESGTIDFDVSAAEAAEIDEEIIANVFSQITYMNELVTNGDAYITEDFAAVQYISLGRATGENKVVTHWYGLSQLYMDSAKADAFYERLLMCGDSLSNYAYEQALEGAGVSGFGGYLAAGYYYNYSYQVGQAKAPGRGIIMNVQTDLVYGGQTIWFSSQ